MAQELELQIVLETLLKSKGFEDAQKALKELADATNESGKKTEDSAKKGARGLEELGGKRGAIADLTRVILMNSGATGAAGEAAKAAGIGLNFMSGAATALSFSMATLTFGLALLLPKIIEWITKSKEVTADQKNLATSLEAALPELKDYLDKLRLINPELAKMAEHIRAVEVDSLSAQLKTANKNLRDAQLVADGAREAMTGLAGQIFESGNASDLAAEKFDKVMKRYNAAQHELSVAKDEVALLTKALKEQLPVAEGLARQHERDAQLKRGVKVTEEQYEKALRRSIFADREKGVEAAKRLKDMQAERDGIFKLILMLRQEETEKRRLRNLEVEHEVARSEAAVEEKQRLKDLEIATIQSGATILGAASSLFGKNKALAIASAIADTYAGADKAFAQGGVFGFVTGAAIIAQGLANVQIIRNQEPGFDDPFSDLVAAKLGRKSAVDFVNNFGAGFQSGLGMRGGGGGGTTVNNQNGMSINNLHMSGIIAGNETELLKQLNRKLIRVQRLENRTRIGA